MPGPTEQLSVQDRIILYASQIGWTPVSQKEAEQIRGFDHSKTGWEEQAANASLFFDELLYNKVKEFNPAYPFNKEELIRTLSQLQNSAFGNRDFLNYLKGDKTFYLADENREYNLKLIDFTNTENNTYNVTKEYYYHNSHFGNREDIVFLINGIPVLVFECKNATKEEAIAIGVDQIRRYHNETPEMMMPQQIFSVTESLGFSYGVTWNINRRNIFNWKHEQIGQLETKVKTFCTIPQILAFIKNYIIFQEKDEVLSKYILRQHQTQAAELVVKRCHEEAKTRGLIWHTQGSGKTFTIIKAAEMLYKAPQSDKPTILLLLDRNELEDQMMRNLEALGIGNREQARSIDHIEKLLEKDWRGIIVCMIHKFRNIKPNINLRKNIYVLIDEAHRTTGGDLGTFLMAAIPNASLIGFSGTPVDKTAFGKGTFKIFGFEDEKGYLHKYSIKESIEDKTTLPLFYALAPNELRVPSETLEKEFFQMAETEGITDIEELNKILEKAVVTKTFLKSDQRVDKVAKYVAEHYTKNVEPLGYKAFLVGVDREACALYKKAIDKYLPPEYSEVVYTKGENDGLVLKEFYLAEEQEKQVRKDFANLDKLPKILIVTEKLLTGYDAPCLYAMYLDKPMRDHTLLQAIARVNRPYENEAREMKKPHGFVLDFIGIFDKLEKALAFDSDEVNAVVKDIGILKSLFRQKMEKEGEEYIKLVSHPFTDKETDKLIEIFKDKSERAEFFKAYKQLEMLYEIISPDAFLAPYIEKYTLLSKMYQIVRNAFVQTVYTDREFMRKTEKLVREKVTIGEIENVTKFYEINEKGLQALQEDAGKYDNVKVINLVKSIEKWASDEARNLMLLSMKQKADDIKDRYEDAQLTTQKTLEELEALIKKTEQERKEQSEKQFDDITYFVFKSLREEGYRNPDDIAASIKQAFGNYPYWQNSDAELRELRRDILFAMIDQGKTDDEVSQFIDNLFSYLFKAFKK